MKILIDTSTIIAAVRSPTGASAEIVRRVLLGQVAMVCSVPLFLEYEAVLLRPEHLKVAGAVTTDIANLLDALAGKLIPVEIQFLWRPQLRDANDDMVLEAAVNGQVTSIITFNVRDFLPQANTFGVAVKTPGDFLKGL
jgi:putative PIN family toxin of toxin-antitoxin system